MQIIQFNAGNVQSFQEQLEEAKKRLLELCERTVNGEINTDVSVVRYNMAREQLKSEFQLEVIGMLDASGFINDILCEAEQKWLRARKVKSHNPTQLAAFLAWEKSKALKGGQQ